MAHIHPRPGTGVIDQRRAPTTTTTHQRRRHARLGAFRTSSWFRRAMHFSKQPAADAACISASSVAMPSSMASRSRMHSSKSARALASPSFACSERSGATPASPQPPATPPPSSPPAPSSLPPPPPPLPSGLGGCGREPLTGAPDGSVWGRGGGGGGFAGLRSAALNGGGGQTARGSAVLKVPQPSPRGPPPGRGGRGGVERAVREPLFLALALSPHRRAAEGNTFFALHALGGGGSDDGGGQPRE
mmetsp:Transcript_40378/g.120389  ORF Transcript_40378/g.120389 Transcript_40378/m.120389 type:complete len:246 (-) Transcript_40378:479-1216(-)